MITPPPPRVSSICCNYSIERLEGLAQGAVNRARFAWCDQQTLRVIDPLHFVPISNRRRTDRGPGLVLEVLDPRESRRARGFPRAQRTSAALDSRLVEVESVASRPPRKRNGGGRGRETKPLRHPHSRADPAAALRGRFQGLAQCFAPEFL